VRPIAQVVGILSLAAPVLLAAEQAPDEHHRRPMLRLLHAYYRPLNDPEAGRLGALTARLLLAAQHMPDEIQLPNGSAASPPPEDKSHPEPPEPVGPPIPAGQQWRPVLDHPVVGEQKLAWVLYRAGLFDEATRMYRRLHDGDKEDQHVLFMLVLCERNTGNLEKARQLLDTMPQDSEAYGWAAWVLDVGELAGAGREGRSESQEAE
jgi:hypothetical protein